MKTFTKQDAAIEVARILMNVDQRMIGNFTIQLETNYGKFCILIRYANGQVYKYDTCARLVSSLS